MHMARAAALEDTRFSPVRPDELGDLRVEISVLSPPEKLAYDSADDLLEKLRPDVDGVVLQSGRHRATFLPQVWKQLPAKTDFLAHLCRKAGIAADAWREGNLDVEVCTGWRRFAE